MTRFALSSCIALLALGGCDFGINRDLIGGGPAEALTADMSVPVGLPCDVARILATNCQACHGRTPLPGVPTSLVTHDNLADPSIKGGTYADRSVARMREPDPDKRMPRAPAPAVPESDIVLFEAWVNAGIPRTDCQPGGPPDLGGLDLAGDLGGAPDLARPLPQQTGLPCDVAAALRPCLACHTEPPQPGVTVSLVTRDHLIAMTSGTTVAARTIIRMTDVANRMPPEPNPPASAQQVMTMQAWLMAGLPRGECGMAGDGGAPTDL